MAIPSGTRLGVYEVTALIGAGGMGEVYKARDTRLNREVALKVLPAVFASDAHRMSRFEREAQLLASLNHANIAAIYGLEETGPIRALVLELVEGPTLAERIRSGPLPVDQALPIARQVADAVEYAHEHKVLHRDLKPANIKVKADGTVRVLDFGLAKALSDEPPETEEDISNAPTLSMGATSPGVILGTAAYMSPEQARGQATDRRSDNWAFGIILYEMLAGRPPFAGSTVTDILGGVVRAEPDWNALPPEVPLQVRWLLRRCLEKDRQRRLQHIGDARVEIEQILNEPALASGTAFPSAVSSLPSSRGLSRRQVLISGAAGLGLLGLGVGTGVVVQRRLSRGSMPTYQRLTFRRGMIRTARFGPDGETVFYGALWDGDDCRVYTVNPSSSESATRGWPAATPLAISASGELALALGTHFRGGMTYGTLARVFLTAEEPRELLVDVKYADWSPDGELAIVRRVAGRDRLEYPIGKVLAESSGAGFSFPRVSPSGDRLAFFNLSVGLRGSVAVVDVRTGEKRTLSDEYYNSFGLAWNGDEIWFTAAAERPLFRDAIYAIPADGTMRMVARIPGNVSLHDISSDGRVLMAHTNDRAGIAVLGPRDTSERDLSWLDSSTLSDISPDGSRILFTENGAGGGSQLSVYLRPTDGSPAKRLADGSAMALSPDGQWALCRSRFNTPAPYPYLNLVPTGPGETRRIERPGLSYFEMCSLPDGQRIVVRAQEQGRNQRLYVQDLFNQRAPEAITPENFSFATQLRPWAVSPDGTMAAVIDSNGKVKLYPVGGGTAVDVPGISSQERLLAWIDGGLLVTAAVLNDLGQIFRVDPRSGRRELWREIRPPDPTALMVVGVPFRVTPDGRSYAYSWHRALSDLYLVDGLA